MVEDGLLNKKEKGEGAKKEELFDGV